MTNRYKSEADIFLHVTKEDVELAECQSPTKCTLARAGTRAIGHPITVAYDHRSGDVVAAWDTVDPTLKSGIRHHSGILEEAKEALRLLLLTDTDRKTLVRGKTISEDGIDLRITEHESRPKQVVRDSVKYEENLAQKRKLNADRRAGIAPPATKSRTPRKTGTRRGIAVAPAS